MIKVRRHNFNPTKNTRVCSRHFRPGDLLVTAGGLNRVQKGATPVLFAWNNYELPTPRRNVWERRPRAESPTPDMTAEYEVETVAPPDHDYCLNPATAVMANQIRELQLQLEVLQLRSRFGIQRLAGSDEDIRFYTRLFYKAIRMLLMATNLPHTSISLPFGNWWSQQMMSCCMFLMHLSVGLHLRDLAERFGIHRTTVSRIISTWTHFLYQLLGSKRLWIPREVVRAHLPTEFSAFPDTQVPAHTRHGNNGRQRVLWTIWFSAKFTGLPFCKKKPQMSREDVRQTQSIARLRVHVE
ncbi:hypothetical protein F7725_013406, partial [Dissostichus mawsoni]